MHISDGVFSLPVTGTAAAISAGILAYSVKGLQSKEIPKISLVTGAFFVTSSIHLPIGPSSVHLLLIGLLGILLGRRAPIAIFVGLLLQATILQHGGIIAIGVNFLITAIPALIVAYIFRKLSNVQLFWRSAITGGLAVILIVTIMIMALLLSSDIYNQGVFSVINVLVMSHVPLIFIEGLMTGLVIRFIQRTRPQLITY
ncbi:CbiM family transporter [Desulfuribacillus alkaliarsenatis]|uniref:Cobalamin biosynthesis protein CbiM n=1 Tax=Desulfuribacillus alkaliarsenatis TaxID=766136 RepID=A0A1E5G4I4_9FIRM|nr:CbiM family transporter [Desulfuribacillus alkaliarsenatis]OEF98002.1 cobalamin biosynthesis protein CbiM [Desulfuribacillus alkaliarsenatis]